MRVHPNLPAQADFFFHKNQSLFNKMIYANQVYKCNQQKLIFFLVTCEIHKYFLLNLDLIIHLINF